MQVFSASRPELIHPFTGLHPAQFHRLVRLVARRGGTTIADDRPGRPWALTLPGRVLLVATSWLNTPADRGGRRGDNTADHRGEPEADVIDLRLRQ